MLCDVNSATSLYDIGNQVRQRLIDFDFLSILFDLLLLRLQFVGDTHHLAAHDLHFVVE